MVSPSTRDIIESSPLMGNSYLDSYNVLYHYPGYFFFTYFWAFSRNLPFYPGLVFVIPSIVAASLISAAVIRIIAQHMARKRVGIGVTGIPSLKRVSRYVLVNSVYWFLIVALITTVFGIPIAIFITFKWMFAGHAVLFEDVGIRDSIKRSSKLFDNQWARSLSYLVLLTLLAILVAGGMAQIPYWGSTAGIMLATLIPPVFVTVYYITLRVDKEAYTAKELAIDLDAWGAGTHPVYPKRAKSDAEYEERHERWDGFWEKHKIPSKI